MVVNRPIPRTTWMMAGLPLMCATAMANQLGPKPTLHTPDVIAPAVLPYLACLYAERGLPLLRANDGSQIAYLQLVTKPAPGTRIGSGLTCDHASRF